VESQNHSLSEPFPNGFLQAPGNLPQDQAQRVLIGRNLNNVPLRENPYPYQTQWNLTLQGQIWGGVAVESAYAGSSGVALPIGGYQMNALSTDHLSLETALNQLVPNPFLGMVTTGTLSQPTVQRGQLLRPYPQYTGVSVGGGFVGHSSYHSLQMKVERRFPKEEPSWVRIPSPSCWRT
jgi:hypothetical protein